MSEQTIPVVDLAEFASGEEGERRVAVAVGDALTDLGFFAVVNHGVDQTLIDRAYQAVEEFFLLPEESKRRYEDLRLKGQRGFTSFGREHAKDHPTPDLKEFWHVGRELPAGHPRAATYPANLWPDEVAEFRRLLTELYRQLDACAARLLEAVARYLGEPRSRFSEIAEDGNTSLRVIHYPPVPEEAPATAVRAAAHEDINLITLLCEA
ncbi:MAG: oxidoreductase, 2OG-Fe(II) oxygenase family, partial [Armatimonadetes bacterium]|nr:oxidoreductase, 2OG-Fe(II) oxygenase family [Armatimonadota bacterium]